MLILVAKPDPEEGGEGSEDEEGGVEQNVRGLRDHSIFECDEERC